MMQPDAPHGVSEAILAHVVREMQFEGKNNLTFGASAQEDLDIEHNLGGWKIKVLGKAYRKIVSKYGLANRGQFRVSFLLCSSDPVSKVSSSCSYCFTVGQVRNRRRTASHRLPSEQFRTERSRRTHAHDASLSSLLTSSRRIYSSDLPISLFSLDTLSRRTHLSFLISSVTLLSISHLVSIEFFPSFYIRTHDIIHRRRPRLVSSSFLSTTSQTFRIFSFELTIPLELLILPF
jgi:hypothetical protein